MVNLAAGLLFGIANAYFVPDWANFYSKGQVDVVGLCPIDLPLSCSNSTPIENTCCFESPSGLFAQTQFWDYNPAVGANETWTLHGLWPDLCGGLFQQFCDKPLEIRKGDLERIIVDEFGDKDLFKLIQENWNNLGGDDESLWVHEFNKHGTCVNTIKPKCYGPDGKKNQNVYDYFNRTVSLYTQYPTFDFLADKGIVPSLTESYTYDQVLQALTEGSGKDNVFFKCDRNNALQEVYYYHYLQGPFSTGNFVQIPFKGQSRCPQEGIRFFPKGGKNPQPRPPKDPSGMSGYLKPSGHSGCLISSGNYYESGTCAKFRIVALQFKGYNILSSKGVCAIDERGDFSCNHQNKPSESQFGYDSSKRTILYGGIDKWCLDESNSFGHGRFQQTPIKVSDGDCESFSLKLD
ncbi:hypothetical protein PUMCH_004754 [Australozyma saopauloensis]|uniref:Ribonuclease T2-like n=1 Tax=Australozyma saopauloensis TaxID=291208 RepID=A0AAX4HFI8_9ASCO|nr:hypothetical protein PUMCH_004754 [[Candida] saopauloensis]